jgi:hypothetical protein
MKWLLPCFFTAMITKLPAQDTVRNNKLDDKSVDRIVFAGSNFKNSMFLYLDGPRILFWLDGEKTTKVGLAFFPTMYYRFNTKQLLPLLGLGPRFDYKKISVGFPFYLLDGKWKPHTGIGLKF